MTPHIIYLSGAITDNPNYVQEFSAAEAALKAAGYKVINPVRRCADLIGWADCMRRDIADLVTHAQGVAIVNDIGNSRGALLELTIAFELGIPVAPLTDWLSQGGEK